MTLCIQHLWEFQTSQLWSASDKSKIALLMQMPEQFKSYAGLYPCVSGTAIKISSCTSVTPFSARRRRLFLTAPGWAVGSAGSPSQAAVAATLVRQLGLLPKASRWGAQATLSQGCGPRCKWGSPWACLQKTLSGTQICHFLLEISHSQKEREKNLRFPSSKHLPRNFKCSHPNPPPFS